MTVVGNWPDPDALTAAAERAGAEAASADATGCIGADVVEALTAAGFPTCFVPRRWGGAELSLDAVTRAVALVGEQNASAAWIASLLAYNGRFGAYLPIDGQKEIWAEGPETRLVSSMVAAGVTAEQVHGGWSLRGRWLYVSGVEFADWALVSSAPPREGDRSILVFAVHRDAFTHERSWSSIGMHGTGSHTLVVDEVFVPEYRTFVWDDMRQGVVPLPATHAQAAPLFSVNGLTFAAPILGAARYALRLAHQHLSAAVSGARAASRQSSRVAFTRAAGEIDAAELLLARVAATADAGPARDGLAERSHRDATLAVELLVEAVDRLFRVTGTRGQAASHGMQRVWRDVHAAASHAALQFEPAALAYTRALLNE
ncbi:acyl-CoA dehydrogenase family protein [Solwaraspora sp. WMMD406]|uniref:acyl-CoA dehydrogenase family protein n=1 Tax=Solwaraspora sp. WMMD406 TaxID=3016095 RepID=UPI0024175A65|nr:acyl-CoA dehydrogenase family protein [Solwaraspora sp. WMMD406]MDG4765865.1 acyl-CoA dehydrogenase family protein [Solwaraspora sp. WMMD406]